MTLHRHVDDTPAAVPSSSFYGPHRDTERLLLDREAECARRDMAVPLFVAGPMVRYSKLPFRRLVGMYGADVIYTPMIYASNFCASDFCRRSEFTTDSGNRRFSHRPVCS
uniref:tRNA-dihydrouridine synthase n=1 Tax=Steinernema glaseri TaxID=37863 RepID=A0A1I7ZVG5_9BILA